MRVIIFLLFFVVITNSLYCISNISGDDYKITITESTLYPQKDQASFIFNVADESAVVVDMKFDYIDSNKRDASEIDFVVTVMDSFGNIEEFGMIQREEGLFSPKNLQDSNALYKLFNNNLYLNIILSGNDEVICKVKPTLIETSMRDALVEALLVPEIIPEIGEIGIAGYVFYDKGYYSDGWRFLEASPVILRIMNNEYLADPNDIWYEFGDAEFDFQSRCNSTSVGVGAGLPNTAKLCDIYSWDEVRSNVLYALCEGLIDINGFTDWFIPSLEEMQLICKNLGDLYPEGTYWTSSVDTAISLCTLPEGEIEKTYSYMKRKNKVILVRQF